MMSVVALYATGKEDTAEVVNYLVDSVRDDEARGKDMKGVTTCYVEGGTLAGRWMGDNPAGLGNASVSFNTGDRVGATQLLDLIEDMVDPPTSRQLGRRPQKAINIETRRFDPP